MASGQQKLGSLLVELGFIDQAQLDSALAEQARSGKRLGKILVDAAVMSEDRLVHALAKQLGLDTCDPIMTPVHENVLALLPADIAFKHRLLPIGRTRKEHGECLYVATADPLDQDAIDALRAKVSPALALRLVLAGETELELALARHYGAAPQMEAPPAPSASTPSLPAGISVIQGRPEAPPAPRPQAGSAPGLMADAQSSDILQAFDNVVSEPPAEEPIPLTARRAPSNLMPPPLSEGTPYPSQPSVPPLVEGTPLPLSTPPAPLSMGTPLPSQSSVPPIVEGTPLPLDTPRSPRPAMTQAPEAPLASAPPPLVPQAPLTSASYIEPKPLNPAPAPSFSLPGINSLKPLNPMDESGQPVSGEKQTWARAARTRMTNWGDLVPSDEELKPPPMLPEEPEAKPSKHLARVALKRVDGAAKETYASGAEPDGDARTPTTLNWDQAKPKTPSSAYFSPYSQQTEAGALNTPTPSSEVASPYSPPPPEDSSKISMPSSVVEQVYSNNTTEIPPFGSEVSSIPPVKPKSDLHLNLLTPVPEPNQVERTPMSELAMDLTPAPLSAADPAPLPPAVPEPVSLGLPQDDDRPQLNVTRVAHLEVQDEFALETLQKLDSGQVEMDGPAELLSDLPVDVGPVEMEPLPPVEEAGSPSTELVEEIDDADLLGTVDSEPPMELELAPLAIDPGAYQAPDPSPAPLELRSEQQTDELIPPEPEPAIAVTEELPPPPSPQPELSAAVRSRQQRSQELHAALVRLSLGEPVPPEAVGYLLRILTSCLLEQGGLTPEFLEKVLARMEGVPEGTN